MESIRQGIEESDLLDKAAPESSTKGKSPSLAKVTTSQGLACFPDHAAEAKALREAADSALYRAKESGRNRVVVAQSELIP